MFTTCFAKEMSKGSFSLREFQCSLMEEEAKAQILKAREDEQNLLSSSNIGSLCVLLPARSLLHIKNTPVSIQALVEQTHFSSARPHLLFLDSFCWFIRKNSVSLEVGREMPQVCLWRRAGSNEQLYFFASRIHLELEITGEKNAEKR